MPKKKINKKRSKKPNIKIENEPSENIAIIALILNIFIPGLGSLIAGKTNTGISQLILCYGGFVIGILLTLTFIWAIIGIPLMIIAPISAWIWGMVTGAELIKKSQ